MVFCVAACVLKPTDGKAMVQLSRHPSEKEASLGLPYSFSDSLLHSVISPSHRGPCHDEVVGRGLTRASIMLLG